MTKNTAEKFASLQQQQNAEEIINSNSNGNEELQKSEQIEMFTLLWKKEKGYQLGFAEYALTPFFSKKEDVLNQIGYEEIEGKYINKTKFNYSILFSMVAALIEIQNKLTKIEETSKLKENGN